MIRAERRIRRSEIKQPLVYLDLSLSWAFALGVNLLGRPILLSSVCVLLNKHARGRRQQGRGFVRTFNSKTFHPTHHLLVSSEWAVGRAVGRAGLSIKSYEPRGAALSIWHRQARTCARAGFAFGSMGEAAKIIELFRPLFETPSPILVLARAEPLAPSCRALRQPAARSSGRAPWHAIKSGRTRDKWPALKSGQVASAGSPGLRWGRAPIVMTRARHTQSGQWAPQTRLSVRVLSARACEFVDGSGMACVGARAKSATGPHHGVDCLHRRAGGRASRSIDSVIGEAPVSGMDDGTQISGPVTRCRNDDIE